MNGIILILVFSILGIVPRSSQGSFETFRQLNTFSEAFRHIRAHSLTPVSDEQLINAAIQGMLQSIDTHSMFIRGTNFDSLSTLLKGEVGGIGIEFEVIRGKIIIVTAFQGSPAAHAGLGSGDEVISINGQSLKGLSFITILERLQGTIGETVALTIKRAGPNKTASTFNVSLQRKKIKLSPITHTFKNNIGYIQLAHFYQTDTVSQFIQALKKIKALSKGQLKGLILDIRNNPGGQVQYAVDIANTLIPKGIIVSLKERPPQPSTLYESNGKILLSPKVPVVVLVNRGTASAGEILAAALQDNKRALIMGQATYGKGTVQTITVLPPGYSALQLTTGEYLTPKGASIQGRGIQPDVLYDIPPSENDHILHQAWKLLGAPSS